MNALVTVIVKEARVEVTTAKTVSAVGSQVLREISAVILTILIMRNAVNVSHFNHLIYIYHA